MNLPSHNQERHIHKSENLSPDLIKSMSRVLDVAAGDLRSNIFLFPDVLSEVNPPELYGRIYGMIRRILGNDPCFGPVDDAVMEAAPRKGPFPVVIWISSLALSPTVPEVFRTGVLAHELGHARQIEHAEEIGDVLDAWDCYEDFLTGERQLLSYWKRPHEIDAELFARKVIQQLHPYESLDPLLDFYKDYEPVLESESSGGFELLKYFKDVIRRGPSGLRHWILTTPNRMCRGNAILLRLAPE